MNQELQDVMESLRSGIRGLKSRQLREIEKTIKEVIESLIDDGPLVLDPDHQLGGYWLESRVQHIFRAIGFEVEHGPDGSYDALIRAPQGWQPDRPVVLEIKSGKATGPGRSELRQLDDWVFELSGEEVARKGKGMAGGNLVTQGLGPSRYSHPTPHKGVMIYNGPIGMPFEDRTLGNGWLGLNENDFANRRAFCIASLACLLKWSEACQADKQVSRRFWETIHNTMGVLPPP